MNRRLMRLLALAMAAALVAAACGNDDDDDTAAEDTATEEPAAEDTAEDTATEEPAADDAGDGDAGGGAAFSIARVEFGEDGFVEIVNHGDAAGDPAGLVVCQFPNYPEVPAGELAPGDTVRVAAADLGGLGASTGEVALYDGRDFENPEAILAYVEWGETDHTRATVAVAAGIWSGEAVTAGEVAIVAADTNPADPSGWTAE